MADNQPVMSKKQKKADRREAANAKKVARKEQKRADRERLGPDYVDQSHLPPAIEVRDIVDWLIEQNEVPHPLATSLEVMMMWFEAMNTGLSHGALRRRLGRVMQLWREEGDSTRVWTREEQDWSLEHDGPDMTPPELTTTWQQFLQERNLQHEVDEQLTQSLQQSMGEREEAGAEDE